LIDINFKSSDTHWHSCPSHGWESCDGSTISHYCSGEYVLGMKSSWRVELEDDIIK